MEYTELDWNLIWQKLYNNNLECRGTNDCASIWASKEKARSFMKQSRENPERIRHVIEGLPIHSGSRVLDIGAGPGTMAIPIAKKAAHVTAVEPSPGMTGVLKEYALEEGLTNIRVVEKRWEDIELSTDLEQQYDVVVASYSLGMPDIREAISAMCQVSSDWVYLFWFADTTSWEQAMIDLWPKLHGREYQRGPKADVLFNLLYSMGFYPNVETADMDHVRRFPNPEAALEEYKGQYGIQTPEQEAILLDYLRGVLVQNGDEFIHSGMTKRVKIWWRVNGCR
ncbi:MAG: class I SAM-dependent methyltransferase [Methanocalculus sp. MSAO_Arc1]|uniref:class I SAM-dependent methyltransferase n=1 Tax=Methanocalculus TaxID=71151 RepID=UPI000FF44A57|nr:MULTISPECIES: class I SAM-dependent methyltransferase [unclassified Methanocalculus]MCP1661525.1 SAM-dependent methyltransferase [Methanocalculus sp. AMF5]RQD81009.1 MAG: class I SAM-dependent methyltransferase [Methanocalculus sp. MSAO_Arc1]